LSLAFVYYKHKPNTPKANHVTHTLYKYELNFSSDFKIQKAEILLEIKLIT